MKDLSTRAPCAPGNAALRAMFAARKRVFIDLLKWDLPALAGEYEVDQFDTPDAYYLILLGPGGEHRASARLLPSTGTHLLGGLYPHLCDHGVPHGPTIREISRFCLDPDQSAAARLAARNQLVTALAEHALREGITHYTGVAEESWFRQIMAFGWRCEALGGAVDDRGARLVGLCIHIDEHTLDSLKRTGVYAPLSLHLADSGEMVA